MDKSAYQCKNVVSSTHSTQNLSRHELLQWINESLGLKIKKVESLSSGAAYCQFMNKLFPGCLSMKKIKLDATVEYDCHSNFKQLQYAFRKVGCDKDVPIDKLIKGRFQENFEFVQWFRKFVDANLDLPFSQLNISGSKQPDVVPKKNLSTLITSTPRPVECAGSASAASKKTSEKVHQLKSEMAALEERADEINKEREFYFNKLRNIEVLCTVPATAELDKETLVSKILAELYATEDDAEETAAAEEETY